MKTVTSFLVIVADVKLRVTRRMTDWHCCVLGDPGTWGCGKTVELAITDCIRTHSPHLLERHCHESL